MLGFPLLYFKGMRLMMFQLYSFYCRLWQQASRVRGFAQRAPYPLIEKSIP